VPELRAHLLDAEGRDEEVDLQPGLAGQLTDTQLLWVDVAARDRATLESIATDLELPSAFVEAILESEPFAKADRRPGLIRLRIVAVEPGDDEILQRRPLDIVAGRNLVVTIHDGELEVFEPLKRELEDETRLGALDAANFVDIVVDSCIDGYFRELETIERSIDALDELALRGRTREDTVLAELVRMRRRIGMLRRTLTPHREAFGPLARPDFELHEELGRPWPGLVDRMERAIEGAENARETLLGSFDIYMGRTAQRANDVMKTLTIVSAVLLPSVVLAGLMGMNFELSFFDDPNNFWWVLAAMATFGIGLVLVSRWRGWI
jgi:magnesium transporter